MTCTPSIFTFFAPSIIIPVSYTHLDVYKRQVLPLKRVISAMLIFITVIGLMPAALAEAAPEAPTTKHICLMDANTGAVLYEKDARSKAYPASTTKIMTTILALELCDNLEEKRCV